MLIWNERLFFSLAPASCSLASGKLNYCNVDTCIRERGRQAKVRAEATDTATTFSQVQSSIRQKPGEVNCIVQCRAVQNLLSCLLFTWALQHQITVRLKNFLWKYPSGPCQNLKPPTYDQDAAWNTFHWNNEGKITVTCIHSWYFPQVLQIKLFHFKTQAALPFLLLSSLIAQQQAKSLKSTQ